MKNRILAMIVLSLVLTLTARAQVPGIINYQGRIVDAGTNFTGTGLFKFALVNNGSRQATATANLSGTFVTSYNVTDGGSGYTSPPAVTITGGGGSGASATANISGGAVTSLTPVSAGTGYTAVPTVTIAPAPPSVSATYWSNDGSSVAGGQPSSAVSVTVTKGLYSVLLGDTTIVNMSAVITASVFANSDVRLRVWFSDGVNGFQQLSPDQRLGAVGYAMNTAGALTWHMVSGTSQQSLPNNGYVANNAAQVIVTLPASPNVGDVVRVSGTGAGGWMIAQNAGQSVLGSTAVYGPPGVTWTARGSNVNWLGVASSADGAKLVAGGGGQIYTSTDSGVTWTVHTNNAQTVASSADGTKLVAGVSGGQIYTSTDSGATWTAHAGSQQWISIASSADGTKLVAVVFGGQIYTSTDSGNTWTPRDSNRGWESVASSADGTKLIVIVFGGQIYTSSPSLITTTTAGIGGALFGGQGSAIEVQYMGNNQFMPLSSAGTITGY